MHRLLPLVLTLVVGGIVLVFLPRGQWTATIVVPPGPITETGPIATTTPPAEEAEPEEPAPAAASDAKILETTVISQQPQFYHGWPTIVRRQNARRGSERACGRPVQLRFVMKDADVFALHFR